jgi:hypothetical protein
MPRYTYFSRATTEWVDSPTIVPEVIHARIPEPIMEEVKPKKKYLPGERLLRKLTKTKAKDRTIERIQKSITKNVNFLNLDNNGT